MDDDMIQKSAAKKSFDDTGETLHNSAASKYPNCGRFRL